MGNTLENGHDVVVAGPRHLHQLALLRPQGLGHHEVQVRRHLQPTVEVLPEADSTPLELALHAKSTGWPSHSDGAGLEVVRQAFKALKASFWSANRGEEESR